ncbi:hypothetical protein NFHSH190041_03420 [Shewanella sp. NFH-SH190041]|uniref:DUF1145 domain-containing protein n=1 Tax=Shewanella sp. NFH-SH190041 TaxID=2950245 RepID=UPI0021C3CC8D|nr:DUF1145 domain-containing protein [Shewanella sp. NFH-SH190041]BDM62890.1 hypothetical protein NFHSH190041_03420 [Shewanella sp. NFH-SH190041]
MKWIIWGGKLLTAGAWLIMLYNLIQPLGGQISVILYLMLAITLLMHSIQLAIFHTAFKPLLSLNSKDYLSVFTFGAFSLLAYRLQVITAMTNRPQQ